MHSMRFASSVILCALIAAGCATMAANAQTVSGNGTGTNNGFYYSLYSSGGSATMTLGSVAITLLAGLASVMWLAVKAGIPAVLR